MSSWQPIETAPKDGTAVLGWIPRLGYVARQDCVPMHWSGWGGGVWENSTSGHKLGIDPTHWMPLPPPPSSLETSVPHPPFGECTAVINGGSQLCTNAAEPGTHRCKQHSLNR